MGQKLVSILLPIIALFFPVCTHASPYITFEGSWTGMFANFQMVLSLCQAYEYEVIQGGHLNFRKNGFYYDAQQGENWWEYYFEPLCFGKTDGATMSELNNIHCEHIEFCNLRIDNFKIIQKYIRLKPHILLKLNTFDINNFSNHYIIGVHYRGTDKECEAARVSYEIIGLAIQQHIASLRDENWKIFIATDEMRFLDYLIALFPGKVCFNTEAIRSEGNRPLHASHPNPYQGGEDAVLDCLLLSKSNILMRTSSNLSLISSFFNPEIPVINLSERYDYQKPNLEVLNKIEKTDPALYF